MTEITLSGNAPGPDGRASARHVWPTAVQFKAMSMVNTYEIWISDVQKALLSVNMSMTDWQTLWPFDFQAEYNAGTSPDDAAMKANRFWWRHQNRSLKQDCRLTLDCWLPRDHQGSCESVSSDSRWRLTAAYELGDYVKVELPDETTGIGEWMWVRVTRCDEEKQLVFGTLDSEPLNDYGGKLVLGTEMAVKYSQVREHKKPTEFTRQ